MRSHQLESWVLDILGKVTKGQPVEDSRVELKAEWITGEKAARRIAGHANAARGESILWIIGADERGKTVNGAKFEELANWWPKVQSCFSELPPQMALSLNVPYGDKVVIAMLFDTERAPFVVKNPNFGHTKGEIEREVPWREGTSIRSAKRADLLKLLSPLQSFPELEILGGELIAREKVHLDIHLHWYLEITLYVDIHIGERIFIPFHRCSINFTSPDIDDQMTLENLDLIPPESVSGGAPSYPGRTMNGSQTMVRTKSQIIINGPGEFYLNAHWTSGKIQIDPSDDVDISVTLKPVRSDKPVRFNVQLKKTNPRQDEYLRWSIG